ncbi:oxidoreductase, partial [Phlegmacium glaucopus]
MFGLSSKWNPDGKHVYITGGSTGLGLSLAQILTQHGAHVSIVARNQKKLDKALAQLEQLRVSQSQILRAYSHSLDTALASTLALEDVCGPFDGQCPDAVFACAGSSKPMFFVEMDEQDLVNGMTNGYWVQAWTAWAAAKRMARENKQGGKIVLVSSTLGYMSFLGWASYSPAKHALRGMSITEENKTKPSIVKKIESTDDGLTAEQAALALFKGVQNGHAHITADLITSLFRASTRGTAYKCNWFLDVLFDLITFIATPIWRASVDKQVVAHWEEHRQQQHLIEQGFFS